MGLCNPYWEQAFAKIELLLAHGHADTITSQLVQAEIEQHQLAVGELAPLLSLPYESHSHLTESSWITSLWEFLASSKISLVNHDCPRLRPLRENDASIMSTLRKHNTVTKAEETSFNRVRCHLQVLTMADIATGDGSSIRQNYLVGLPDCNKSSYIWQVEHPGQADFACWRRLITSFMTPTQVLHTRLGRWIAKPHRKWEWFYCCSSDRVFQQCPTGWKIYCRSQNATRRFPLYITSGAVVDITASLQYATVSVTSATSVTFEGAAPNVSASPLQSSFAPLPHDFWVLQESNIDEMADASWVLPALHSHSVCAVCDGSFQPVLTSTGISAAWVIEFGCPRYQIKGHCSIQNDIVDPYRAELLGIYAVLSALYFLELCHPTYKGGFVRIGCDNKAAGEKSMLSDLKVSCKHKHMDLVKAILVLRHKLRTRIEVYHLYGHQDSTTPFHLLPRDAQLNVEVDESAVYSLQLAHEHNSFHVNPTFPCEGWQVRLPTTKIYCNFRHRFRSFLGTANLREYLYSTARLAWTTFPQVDFDPLENYLSSHSRAFSLWYVKHWTNFCGIGKMQKRMRLWNNDLCPCCNVVPEHSTVHLFLCPAPNIRDKRETGFREILVWLEDVHTAPELLHMITSLWFGRIPSFDNDASFLLRKMWAVMAEMGNQSMWLGFLPRGMVAFQQAYYQSLGLKKTGSKWASRLVGRMLRVTHSLWMERNNVVHLKTAHGLKGMHLMELQEEVEFELSRGVELMEVGDHHLMDVNLESLMADSLENLRGWLCSVKIARGDCAAAEAEGLRDRGLLSHAQPSLSAAQLRGYLNWKNIQLSD